MKRIKIVLTEVEALPEDFRIPIWLHYIEKMTLREVGDALGLSEVAAAKRVSRGLAELRTLLQRTGITSEPATRLFSSLPLESTPAIRDAAAGRSSSGRGVCSMPDSATEAMRAPTPAAATRTAASPARL